MKPHAIFLSVSLAANAILAALYWRSTPTKELAPKPMPTAVAPPPPKPLTRDAEIAAALQANPEFAAAIKSGDPKRLRAALIAAGFPDSYVRDMVTFLTGSTVTPEHLALLRMRAERPFWKVTPSPEELALQKSLRDLEAKNSALTKAAFGGKIPPHPLEALNQQRRYHFLPDDKVAAVAAIDADYAASLNGMPRTPGAGDKQRQLIQEKRAELAKVLTPQELELYDLYVSPTADIMRHNLALFAPTEAEFRNIFELRQDFDEKHPMFAMIASDRTEMEQRAADQKTLDDRLRGLLGDQRFEEYTRAQNPSYQAAVEIATHYNLPPTAAVETYALQQSFQKRSQDLMRAPATDRPTQATALLHEFDAELTKLLGAPGADAYKKTGGRMWMTMLERSAKPPAPRQPGR